MLQPVPNMEPTVVGSGTRPTKIHANNRFNYINVATTLQHVLQTKGRRLSCICSISKFTCCRAPAGPNSSSLACHPLASSPPTGPDGCMRSSMSPSRAAAIHAVGEALPPGVASATHDGPTGAFFIYCRDPEIFLPQKSRGDLAPLVGSAQHSCG